VRAVAVGERSTGSSWIPQERSKFRSQTIDIAHMRLQLYAAKI
jgi:hypothetical protein